MALGVWRIAAEEPFRVALVEAAGETVTYGQLAERANRLTPGPRGVGLGTGDVVAAVLPNQSAIVELQLAAIQGGLYLVPISNRLTGPEIAHIVADSGARVLVCSSRFADACRDALESLETPPAALPTGAPAPRRRPPAGRPARPP